MGYLIVPWVVSLLAAEAASSTVLPAAPMVAQAQLSSAQLPARVLSEISLPVGVRIADLQVALDAALAGGRHDGQIYFQSGMPIGPGTAQVEVLRNGPVGLEVLPDGTLVVAMPLRINARGDWETPERVKIKLGPFKASFKTIQVKHHEETSAQLTVRAAIALDVTPAWSVHSRSNLSFSWDEKPVIDVGPISISLGSVAGAQIDKYLAGAAPKLDEAIARQVPLRAVVERAWAAMHQPIQLTASPATWLRSEPVELMYAGLGRRGDALTFTAGVRAYITTTMGAPPAAATMRSLPSRGALPAKHGQIRIHAEQRIALSVIEAAVQRSLAAAPLDLLGPGVPVPVQLASVSLRAAGAALAARGTLTVTLSGQPTALDFAIVLDPTSGPGGGSLGLSVTSIELTWPDTVTVTPVMDGVRMGVEAVLARVVNSQNFSVEQWAAPLRQRLQQQIAAIQVVQGVTLAANLDKVGVGDLRVEGEELCLNLVVLGSAAVTVSSAALRP